jgi:hypothetical protein
MDELVDDLGGDEGVGTCDECLGIFGGIGDVCVGGW